LIAEVSYYSIQVYRFAVEPTRAHTPERAMTPVEACSICGGAIVGFGNIVEPIRTGRC
jgi:hypothetical protein